MAVHKGIVKARAALKKAAPYFAVLLGGLAFKASRKVERMAVNRNGAVLYNPDAADKLHHSELMFDIGHELMHVVNRHHVTMDAVRAEVGADKFNVEVFNAAADMPINSTLIAMGLNPGKTAEGKENCVLAAHYSLPEGRTVRWYYTELMRSQKDIPKPDKQQCLDPERDKRKGEKQKKPSGGGSDKGGGSAPAKDDGSSAGDADGDDSNAGPGAERVVALLTKWAAEVSKTPGTLPGNLRAAVEALVPPVPAANWRSEFMRAIGTEVSHSEGWQRMSWVRPSRLQAAMGTGKGSLVLPGRANNVPSVLLVVDTSGSMNAHMAKALGELDHMIRAVGAPVTVAMVDTRMHVVKNVHEVKTIAKDVRGGGGTSFQPPFDWVKQQPMAKRPKLVVYLTDGIGKVQAEDPGVRTIWVVPRGFHKPAAWGREVSFV